MKDNRPWLTASLLGLLGSSFALAHHSAIVYYDLDSEIVLHEATVVEWRFTNPHAQLIFKATDDNGELVEWTASTGNVNSLIRLGYSAGTFEPGQVVTVYGNPARDGTSNMGALQVAIRGGDLVKFSIDDSLISLDTRPVAALTSEADGAGLTGVWRFIYGPIGPELKALVPKDAQFVDGYGQAQELVEGETGDFPLTEKGRAFQASWRPSDNVCKPPSPWVTTIAPYLIEFEQERAARIHLRYEYMDQERTIWLDGRGHPSIDRVPRSLQGHSVGHWDGDTLVVETTNMVANQVTRNGIQHTENAVIKEWFSRQGDMLTIVRVLEDPEHFTGPVAEVMQKQFVPGGEVIPYGECVP